MCTRTRAYQNFKRADFLRLAFCFLFICAVLRYIYIYIMVQSLAEDIVSTAWTSICKGLASCFGAFVTFWHGCGETQNAEVGCYFLCVVGGHGGNVSASVILFKLSNFSVKIQLTLSPSPKTPPTNATHTHTHTHRHTKESDVALLHR